MCGVGKAHTTHIPFSFSRLGFFQCTLVIFLETIRFLLLDEADASGIRVGKRRVPFLRLTGIFSRISGLS